MSNNSVVWLTPELKFILKQSLLSISVNALRNCLKQDNNEISFERLHTNAKKCTPSQIMVYQAALHLHKVLNQEVLSLESITVLYNMTCTRRQTYFEILRDNNGKIGMNTTSSKFYCLSGKISLLSLNMDMYISKN